MAKHTAYIIPGTWEIGPGHYPNTPIGMLKGVSDRLNRTIWNVQHVNYPARFGPIANNGEPPLSQLGSPSYAQSVDMGVDEVVRLIESKPGTFAVLGYSQGGAIASRIGQELLTGRLAHRKNDCLWLHTFASPHRDTDSSIPGVALTGEGISGEPLGGFRINGVPDALDWFDYGLPNDIYVNAPVNSYCRAGYELVKDMSLIDPIGWATAIGLSITNGEVAEANNDLATNPLVFAAKVATTIDAVNKFGNSHTDYGNTSKRVFNGKTAVEHSAFHLNYWGARR
ncbi:PE-PPE domain-containing protein [Gordonia malaquae]|uniref:Putative structural protein n=1 Tax=Gordonia phage GRU3 TaxID=1647473 RepID=A0A0K0N5P6_9CAUD|nr:putative structural protein [Gordonia phage GRU3]AKJ72264.1 putative structural protein [Gordonia phage GRU3]